MWVRLVVCLHPPIETGLQLRSCSIDLFPDCHTIALIQHGLVEPFTDPIGLGGCVEVHVWVMCSTARYRSYAWRPGDVLPVSGGLGLARCAGNCGVDDARRGQESMGIFEML